MVDSTPVLVDNKIITKTKIREIKNKMHLKAYAISEFRYIDK